MLKDGKMIQSRVFFGDKYLSRKEVIDKFSEDGIKITGDLEIKILNDDDEDKRRMVVVVNYVGRGMTDAEKFEYQSRGLCD